MKTGYTVALLMGISLLPILAGLARVSQLTAGAPVMDITPASQAMPLSLMVHILTASVFLLLGAVQFLPATRRGGWHRLAGRVTVLTGLVAAASGLWMTLLLDQTASAGPLLVPIRAAFSLFWLVALVLGLAAILRKDIPRHRTWMYRSYAIGAGTGVQSLLLLPYFFLIGVPSGLPSDLVILTAWLFCLAVAEAMRQRS